MKLQVVSVRAPITLFLGLLLSGPLHADSIGFEDVVGAPSSFDQTTALDSSRYFASNRVTIVGPGGNDGWAAMDAAAFVVNPGGSVVLAWDNDPAVTFSNGGRPIGPEVLLFNNPVDNVAFRIGGDPTGSVTVTAFRSGSQVALASTSSPLSPVMTTVSVNAAEIGVVTIWVSCTSADCYGALDDLTFSRAGDGDDSDGDGVADSADCDPLDASIFPGAAEACDGRDNNCDGTVPGNEVDGDGDGSRLCHPDCDDSNADIYPGAPELCDEIDNDCDTVVPADELDADMDGFRGCEGDCLDDDSNSNPNAQEVCDGVDNDCDGELPADEVDEDLDAVLVCEGDCLDDDELTYPEAEELCDGVDNDCDEQLPAGELDEDADGVLVCMGDCDDEADEVYPDAEELCNEVDDDCDGITDPECDGELPGGEGCDCSFEASGRAAPRSGLVLLPVLIAILRSRPGA